MVAVNYLTGPSPHSCAPPAQTDLMGSTRIRGMDCFNCVTSVSTAGRTPENDVAKFYKATLEGFGRKKKKKAHTNMSAHSFLFVLTQSFANNGTCEGTKRNSGSFRETLAGAEVNTRWQMRIPLFRLTTQ